MDSKIRSFHVQCTVDRLSFHLASLRAKKRGDSVFLIGLLNPASRYKKQIEDAEEIAALNLAKYRKAQQQLEEAEERTKNAEGQIDRLRHERGASMMVRVENWNEVGFPIAEINVSFDFFSGCKRPQRGRTYFNRKTDKRLRTTDREEAL